MIIYYTSQPADKYKNPLYRKHRIREKFIEKGTVAVSRCYQFFSSFLNFLK